MSDAKKREQLYPSLAFFVASFIMIIAAIIWGVNKRGFAVIFVISLLSLLCLLAGAYLLHLYLQTSESETDFYTESVEKPRIIKHSKIRQQIPSNGQRDSKVKVKHSHVGLVDEDEESLEDSVQSYLSHSHPAQSKRPYGVSARPMQRQAKVCADEEPDWRNENDTDWEEDSDREESKQAQDSESVSYQPIISKPLRPRQQQSAHSQSGQLVRKTSSVSSHSQSHSHAQLIRKNSSQIL